MPHAELVGPFPEGADPVAYDQQRRRLLWSLPSGLYLLSSRAGEERNLMAVSLVSQLATDPKLLGVAVEREAATAALIRGGGAFGLAVLARGERDAVRHFVKPAAHDPAARTLAGTPYTDAPVTGLPVPALAGAFLDCRVTAEHDLGSHLLFVGEVVDALVSDEKALVEPLRMEDTRMSYGG
ncbi:MAG TPA: flavin reductase family protein [Acidimicrobiales bacterium]|nr:flavin reductase family protein [Acidimicrobiales bacterium]